MVDVQYMFIFIVAIIIVIVSITSWSLIQSRNRYSIDVSFLSLLVLLLLWVLLFFLFLKHYTSRVHAAPSLPSYVHSGICIVGFFVYLSLRAPTLFPAHMVDAEWTQKKYEVQILIRTWIPCSKDYWQHHQQIRACASLLHSIYTSLKKLHIGGEEACLLPHTFRMKRAVIKMFASLNLQLIHFWVTLKITKFQWCSL